jgi:hypothetical protein
LKNWIETMPLALSKLALPAFDHLALLPELRALGVEGIEIAPDRTWPRPYFGQGFSAQQGSGYRGPSDKCLSRKGAGQTPGGLSRKWPNLRAEPVFVVPVVS